MNRRAFWMIGLALFLGVASVFLARNWLQSQVQPVTITQQLASTKIVVAVTPLKFGMAIHREHLRLVDWPSSSIPVGAFTSLDALLSEDDDRIALRAIEMNEPILETKISGFGARPSLSTIIDPPMRGATIRVNDISGVAGFVTPGDRVDIMITRNRSNEKKELINDVVLQNVKVLAIDQIANESQEGAVVVRAVTLEVTTQQAQKLALAQQVGSLSLALRHINNTAAVGTRTVTVNDLKGGQANKVKKPQARLVSAKRTTRAKRSPFSGTTAVTVIRALQSTEYRVRREAPAPRPTMIPVAIPAGDNDKTIVGAVDPAISGPLDLLPRTVTESDLKAQSASSGEGYTR